MSLNYSQHWHPRHWLMPLGLMGTSIMLVFILNVFVPHKGFFLPSADQVVTYIDQQAFIASTLMTLVWIGFWTILTIAAVMIPYFIYKSVTFLKAGAHEFSDKDVMETAGWFGIPLTLAMFGNVTSFATIMLFGLDKNADDIIWPFWLAYNTVIALMALMQFIWYRKVKARSEQPEKASMVVPFALGFMGLNLAGPGALGSHDAVVTTSMMLSLGFMVLSIIVFVSKLAIFKSDFVALFKSGDKNAEAMQIQNWGQLMNFGTAITTFNVWIITSVRNYLNLGHNFAEFDLAIKNSITWSGGLTVPLALLVIALLWKRGFFSYLFNATKPLVFSLGLICMLVSSYVVTALFTMTAIKLGLVVKGGVVMYALLSIEGLLLLVTLATVAALVYRMILKNNVQCWSSQAVKARMAS